MGIVIEHVSSRQMKFGKQSGSTRVYKLMGTDDEFLVRDVVYRDAPLTDWLGHLRMTADCKPKGNGVWEVTVEYGLGERESQSPPGENSNHKDKQDALGMESTFDTSGGTLHITQSIFTHHKYKAMGDARGFLGGAQGAIGLSKSGVAGVDVVVPKFTWTETWKFPADAINWGYAIQLRDMTGKVNSGKFRGADAGEVLFAGATGAPDGTDKYRVTYTFHAEKNRTVANGDPINDFPAFGPVEKDGWDYLWVAYEDGAGADWKAPVPRNIFVEQVYYQDDFSKIGIGT